MPSAPTPAHLTAIRRLSPHLAVLTLSSPEWADRPFAPGDKVKLAAPEAPARSYTPARFDDDAGTMDLVVHLHGHGPTARWAATATIGERVPVWGPVPSLRQLTPPTGNALFYGDETALGLAVALAARLPDGIALDGVIEVDPEDLPGVAALGLSIGRARTAPGEVSLAHAAAAALGEGSRVWLSGRAETVRALHDRFVARGLSRDQLVAKPYWSERGTAERKAIAAAVA